MLKWLSFAFMLFISDLSGLWTRSLMAWPDGRRDTTTNVGWLQGISIYSDLRQPPVIPDFSHAKGLADLTLEDCAWLATQQGFAGIFRPSGENFEWLRLIDFQPPRAEPDIGRLFWRDDILIEEGLQGEYIEHWHRNPNQPTVSCAALTLAESQDRRWGCLLRVGDMFMFARDRAVKYACNSLAAAVATAPDLNAAQALVDFEISSGQIAAGIWKITRSTLPFRVGDRLNQAMNGTTNISISERNAAGTPATRPWDITSAEGDVSLLR